ncbi:MAG: NHLP family bacteriocin export ABC transporter peptidase/permease/ATPase subunit [Pelagibacterium sp. SCN 63-23]|nr:MAG: NHLP family bacteriocin export ABC transporter peptidase/permease/ATPase subunit [Pelagibacterium sp. SCN 63-23]
MSLAAPANLQHAPGEPRRRAVPSVLQIEQTECGAASLAMILAHHGRWITLEEMRERTGVSRDGTKASNLLKAARSYGLSAKGFRKEADRLAEVPWPAILHWNFNHFVVLEGIVNGKVYINDPAIGRRTLSFAELSEAFTGVVLAFEKGPDFHRSRRPASSIELIRERLRGSRLGLVLVVLATLLLIVPGLALPAFSRIFIDEIVVAGRQDWFASFALALAFVAALQGLLTAFQQTMLVRLETRLAIGPAADMVRRLLSLPASFFLQRHPGEIVNRVEANERVAQLLSGALATNMFNLLTVLAYAALMLVVDPVLAIAAFLAQGLLVVLVRWSAERQVDAARRLSTEMGRLVSVTLSAVQGIETVRATNREHHVFRRWAGHQARLLSIRTALARTDVVVSVLPALLAVLTNIMVLGLGSARVMAGELTLGGLLAFQALTLSFTAPLFGLVALVGEIQTIRADLARIGDVLRAKPLVVGAQRQQVENALLEVSGLSFGYNPLDPPLLDNISLSVVPGRRVAIVGGSGSGKSTLGRVIAGLHAPWAGQVTMAGHDLTAFEPRQRAELIGYVDQDVYLFEGSIRTNLSLWNPELDDAVLLAALDDAGMANDIAARRGGLDAIVTEGGGNFSGGQRQRLELARALVNSPGLLILDEATSALDPLAEAHVNARLKARGMACLIIAHRLSSIRDCDEIIVMKAGRIVERGTHQALMQAKGEYHALVDEEA